MKKKVIFFIIFALVIFLILPAINICIYLNGDKEKKVENNIWDISSLYNFDFGVEIINNILFPYGISLAPSQVVIGKNGWLYLGDDYEKTVTTARRSPDNYDVENFNKINEALNSWKKWMGQRGIEFRVISGPDKNSIYPEFLPDWMVSPDDSVTNSFFKKMSNEIYFDSRPALLAAKSQHTTPLYFKTDTHWNSLGAWHAYLAFMNEFSKNKTDFKVLSDNEVKFFGDLQIGGGDLSGFLHLQGILKDVEPILKINVNGLDVEIEQYDFESGNLIVAGGNPTISAPQKPLLVKNKKALNQKKLLWLRDSFGVAMSPFVAATFSEVLQLHYGAKAVDNPGKLAELIERYSPDYVFITAVERGSRDKWFMGFRPIEVSYGTLGFDAKSTLSPAWINDLDRPGGSAEQYKVVGGDPFLVFNFSKPVSAKTIKKLAFDLECLEKQKPIGIQVFWLNSTASNFSETDSVKFMVKSGSPWVDLSSAPQWASTKELAAIRIDIDSPDECPSFNLSNIRVGL
jgi:alginate O-acetyltransferase complex protein AlgJ